ncbi:MAG: glycoside hydrolase family 15 protein [Candidatus Omnitrophica bacterium]|nr:glycoside hydrolase family 15 protein [Candidatus Omnitrophota bacterium]
MNYAVIGNCTSGALIDKNCSIIWLCLPFFDSPSLFGRILDEQKGGYFRIWAKDIVHVKQQYVHNTPILKTRFTTKDGIFEVMDYMPRFLAHDGEVICPPEIHRNIYLVEGNPQLLVDLQPCPNYGLAAGAFTLSPDYIKISSARGEYSSFYLYSNLDFNLILSGKPLMLKMSAYFVLSYHEKLTPVTQERIYLEYERTKSYWMDWAYRTNAPEKYRDIVIRSIITLKLLMFQRTGSFVAALTTSLPETVGQDRNWDYRYCWVRDASMIIDLFARIGHIIASENFIKFILGRMLLKKENISVMYGINGESNIEEQILDHLAGYMNSRPVRIGNAAYRQRQNDVYGELIEAIYSYFIVNAGNQKIFNEELWTVVRSLANRVIEVWNEPDCGIWERRGPVKHFVNSKMMCWVALDRAAKIAKFIGKEKHVPQYLAVAQEIKADILKNGWDAELNSFVMQYGSKDLDASNLLMFHYGFLDASDPRMIGTVEATMKHLLRDGFVMRYTAEDEFGVPQNAFIICTFWLINALFLIRREKEAREMFDEVIKHANSFGLLSEGIETKTGALTGNFPQGYSHLALIQTAFLLETDYEWRDNNRSSYQ